MLLEDSFSMSVMFVAMGLFLVVFGTFLVECKTTARRDPHKKGIAKKLLVFLVLANIYVFTEQIVEIQVSPILLLVHLLNVVLGIILLALFCVFIYRNLTVHRDIVKFNTLLVWLTIIFAATALGMRLIQVIMSGEFMPGDVYCVTHSLAILLFSIFGNLMILDFIMNNREPLYRPGPNKITRLIVSGGK